MAEDASSVEAMLKLLGERVQSGVAKLHPPSTKTLAAVDQIVTEQWQREQQVNQMLSQGDPSKGQNPTQEQSLGQAHEAKLEKDLSEEKAPGKKERSPSQNRSKPTGQSNDQGHDHDPGHDHGH
jgi:hypothetical protein